MVTINIAKDYTIAPGGRYAAEGGCSGEDFRETLLMPKYLEAKAANESLVIEMDGGYGYPASWLEEAFGGLVRKLKDPDILDRIKIVYGEESGRAQKIRGFMEDALMYEMPDGR